MGRRKHSSNNPGPKAPKKPVSGRRHSGLQSGSARSQPIPKVKAPKTSVAPVIAPSPEPSVHSSPRGSPLADAPAVLEELAEESVHGDDGHSAVDTQPLDDDQSPPVAVYYSPSGGTRF